MEIVQSAGAVAAAIVTGIGAVGGLWSLSDRVRDWRRSRIPVGRRGVNWMCVSRTPTSEGLEFELMIDGDLWHILRPMLAKPLCGKLKTVEQVGEFYRCTIIFPPGVDPRFRISKPKR